MSEAIENKSEPVAAPAPGLDWAEGIPLARPVGMPVAGASPAPRREMLLESATARSAWLDVICFLVLVACFSLGFESAIAKLLDIPLDASESAATEANTSAMRDLLLPALVSRAGVCAIVIVMILRVRGQTLRSLGLARTALGWNLLIGVGVMVAAYIGLIVPFTLRVFWPQVFDDMRQNAENLMKMIPRMSALGLGAIAVLVGFYEELVFRGFLMTRLRRATQSWSVAVVLTTAVFTTLHAPDQTLAALIWIALLSLLLSGVTIWRKSLTPAIVGHVLFDLSQLIGLSLFAGESWR